MKDRPNFSQKKVEADRIVDDLMSNPGKAETVRNLLQDRLSHCDDSKKSHAPAKVVDADVDDLWDNVPV